MERMKRWILLRAAMTALTMSLFGVGTVEATPTLNPIQLYGHRVVFEILRDGKPVGRQEIDFSEANGALIAHETAHIVVKMLFMTLFHVDYDGTSVWRDGQLQSLSAHADYNGQRTEIEMTGASAGPELKLRINGAPVAAPATLFPVLHWNIETLRHDTVLNPLKGQIAHIKTRDQGSDTVATATGPRRADRWVYSGDLDLTAWYDADGRWCGLRFRKAGSIIEYRCLECGPPAQASTAPAPVE